MHHGRSLLTVILLEHNSYICPNIIFQATSSLGMQKSTAAVPLDYIVPAIFYEAIFAPVLLWEVQLGAPEETAPVCTISPPRLGTTGGSPHHPGKMTNPWFEHWKHFISRALNRLCLLAITHCFCIQIVRAITALCRCNQAAVQDSVSG